MEQWILVLLFFSYLEGQNSPTPAMTSISGFQSYDACKATGDAWVKTKHEADRDYECLPAKVK